MANQAELMPLVDRQEEVALLRSRLDGLGRAEPAQAVLLVGSSGVGKSRLVAEAIQEARQRGIAVLQAQCLGGGAEPLLPLRDALASYLGRSVERIRDVFVSAAPALLEDVPFVGKFLSQVGQAVVAGPQLGGSSVEGVYAGVTKVLLGLAERTGLCLAIEDLHAADQDTLFFLSYFLHKSRSSRALALCTIQEEYVAGTPLDSLIPEWASHGSTIVTVGPLSREQVGDYVTTLSADHPPSARTVDLLYGLTGGNPFLLQEMLQLIADQPAMEADSPTEQIAITLPKSIGAILDRRLLSADPQVRAFLDVASVTLQTTSDLELIASVLGQDQRAALGLLTQACRSHYMTEGPQGEVRFVHDLLRRVVYSELSENSRRFFHSQAAEWLEHAGHVTAAAYQYERGHRIDDMVRTALQAASSAEHSGMYRTALTLYEKLRPVLDERELGPKLCKAYLVMGQWQAAEALLARLPAGDYSVRLLWSELHFVRGDFRQAAVDIQEALRQAPADRLDGLIRLADVHLYLGEFDTAAQRAADALDLARRSASASLQARCLGILGATQFFVGAVDQAWDRWTQALDLLRSCPPGERDQTIYTVILHNLGQACEVRHDWNGALQRHGESLQLRRDVSDAQGVLQSLHEVAKAHFGLGEFDAGRAALDESERLAVDLGEHLEQSKIAHTRARLALLAGNQTEAIRRAEEALDGFLRAGTIFDACHTRLTLAQIYAAAGDDREAVQCGWEARAEVERRNFGILQIMFPGVAFSYAERITAGLLAYACGDALGLPWENGPAPADDGTILSLPAAPSWPRGSTSDDTALTLLVAQHLVDHRSADPAALMALLAERQPQIRGLGPSTAAAIEHYRQTGSVPESAGNTNGAVMRALPIGWAVPFDQPDRRREWTMRLSAPTHPGREARCAACIASACAAFALEGSTPQLLLDAARTEAAAAVRASGADPRIETMLAAVDGGKWAPGREGISLDPYETLTAVLHCVLHSPSLKEALLAAVRLGGDTDTVAALVGGLLGSQRSPDEVREELSWCSQVGLPEMGPIETLSRGLASMRVEQAGG
jgi:ADP-ribosylglycohydrolase